MAKSESFETLYNKARMEGLNAVRNLAVVPMVVEQHASPLDDSSPVVYRDFVPDGLCGFAWVVIKPANSAFAKFLKRNYDARRSAYGGGIQIWISDFGQSYQKKMAFASGVAKVLQDAGINAYADGRLD